MTFPMIKQSSIDEVKSKADITDVINRYTTVKKNSALCPFHEERSPSFHIKQSKQIFKCFGCGEGGDVFKFIMKKERLTFIESVEYLANLYNISLEYDQQSQAEAQEIKDTRKEMLAVTEWAHKKYVDALLDLPADAPAIKYLQQRGYDQERIKAWDLGFAPDTWDFIKSSLINMGKYNVSVDCGLISTKDEKNYDFYRNRIIIPIHDVNGFIIGLAGRIIPSAPVSPLSERRGAGGEAKQVKYLNPRESLIYIKRKIWYGLWQAQEAIRKAGFAYIVEGYMDVQSMHDADVLNTVASCGTEIDEEQAKLLRRYTDHVVICYDGDTPGVKKALKQIDLFLKLDFKVSTIELPDKMDPDEYINHYLLIQQKPVDGAFAE